MIIIQDVHQVIGRRELDFEAAYRDVLCPQIGTDPATQVVYFAWSPHGGGEGYEAVTLTSVENGAALERYQERLRGGDLGEFWTQVEGMRYSMSSSLHQLGAAQEAWQRQVSPAAAVAGTLHRLDALELSGPVSGSASALDRMVLEPSDGAVLNPVAWWSPWLEGLDRAAVSVLSVVSSADALRTAFDAASAVAAWPVSAEEVLSETTLKSVRRLLRPSVWN